MSKLTKKNKEKRIRLFHAGSIHQFFIGEDGKLRMWVNERSGVFTIPLDDKNSMSFLADLDYKLKAEEGTVYKYMGIVPNVQSN